MCGRFTLTEKDPAQLALELGVDAAVLEDYRPRYNIAPTDPHWIMRVKYEDRELLPAKWGLINSWAKDNKRAAQQINARAETLESRAGVQGRVRRAPLRRAGGRLLRVDRAEDRAAAALVPPARRRAAALRRALRVLAADAGTVGADVHDRDDRREQADGAGARPDAGHPGRTTR